jgi:hypothetical protein
MQVQFAVVGAGPAGVAAARSIAAQQGQVALIDRRPEPGGRCLWAHEIDGTPLRELAAEVPFFGRTFVWGLFERGMLACEREGRSFLVHAERVVLATGARLTLSAFPGWEQPAVWSVQRLLARIEEETEVGGLGGPASAATRRALPALDAAAEAGATLVRIAGPSGPDPEASRVRPVEAREDATGLLVRWADQDGEVRLETRCDILVIAAGEGQRDELARQAGCRLTFDERAHDWLVAAGDVFDTSQPHVFAVPAGPTTAVETAAGAIAGLAAMHSLFPHAETAYLRALEPRRRAWVEAAGACRDQATPGPGPAWLARPDVLCPCEGVTAAAARAAGRGLTDPNEWKRATRIGMGICQGRHCRRVAAAFLTAETGRASSELPPPSCRPPIWPVSLRSAAAIRRAFALTGEEQPS